MGDRVNDLAACRKRTNTACSDLQDQLRQTLIWTTDLRYEICQVTRLKRTDLSGNLHCLPRYFSKQTSHWAFETDKMKPLKLGLRIVWCNCHLARQKLRIVGLISCCKDNRVELERLPSSEDNLPTLHLRNLRTHGNRTFRNFSEGPHIEDGDAALACDLMKNTFYGASYAVPSGKTQRPIQHDRKNRIVDPVWQ